jgi:hypothetical protein
VWFERKSLFLARRKGHCTTSETKDTTMVATRRNKKQGIYQKGDKVEVSGTLLSSIGRVFSKADTMAGR